MECRPDMECRADMKVGPPVIRRPHNYKSESEH
jgi:hypothetical protein